MRAVLRNVELAPTQKLIEIKTVFSKISDEISRKEDIIVGEI
jgi:hypothetical protein